MDNSTFRTIRRTTVWIIIASSIVLFVSYYAEILWKPESVSDQIRVETSQNKGNSEVKSGLMTTTYDNNDRKPSYSTAQAIETSMVTDDQKTDDNYVAICMSVRNQSLDLPEFLTHHYHHLGIRHFYIQDDGTVPPLSTHAYPIPSTAITFTYYPRDIPHPNRLPTQPFQPFAYEECNKNFGHKHTWIAYLDTDEFLEMTSIKPSGERETVLDFLRGFERNETVGAIAANWRLHTSSSHLTRQSSVRKSYTTCITDTSKYDNRFIKTIVKTSAFKSCINPHWFYLQEGKVTVGEAGDLIGEEIGWRTPVRRKRIAVHHFATKSKEEFAEKVGRGSGMGVAKGWGWWEFLHALPEVKCEEMVGYVP